MEALVSRGIPAAPLCDPRTISTHPQMVARAHFETLDHPVLGPHTVPTFPFKFASIINVAIMTFVLITSSLTMLGAVDASKAGDKPKALRFLASTMVLGLIFAGLHIREWFGLFDAGIKLSYGLFGQTFFSIIGLHLLHVITGVVALGVVARKYSSGSLTPGHVETTGLYWHFVDLVWMFVVPLVYLTNIAR